MSVLGLHADAIRDLEAIRGRRAHDADLIVATLEAIEEDPELADNLLDHGFGANANGPYNVSKWNRLWRDGMDLWRMRCANLERLGLRYRIVYAYIARIGHRGNRFVVLAIVQREEIDYDDPTHPLATRIRAAYDGL